jgi:hypothetical protein
MRSERAYVFVHGNADAAARPHGLCKTHSNKDVRRAIQRAAGIFLGRELYRRRSDGSIIHIELGAEVVDWGGTSKRLSNPWVTADALSVLKAAGRI